MFKSLRRSLLVLVLALCFNTPGAQATDLSSFWRQVGSWLGTFGITIEHGCSIDPNGRCLPPEVAKNGCSVDPSGRRVCGPVPTLKAGCTINPDGKPNCAP